MRSHRRLTPLWTALREGNPRIALLPEPAGPAGLLLLAHQASLRLVRRVVEINDGLVALRPHTSAAIAGHARELAIAAGMTGERLDAVVHAAVIAAALPAQRAGEPPPPAP